MQTHERTMRVSQARASISMQVWEMVTDFDLTYGEALSILADTSMSLAKYLIRWERHGDVNMEGDLSVGPATVVCWDCLKGRHAICPGTIPDDERDDEDESGRRCECPVCHGNRYVNRQPEWDAAQGCYVDPGPEPEDPDSE